MSADLIATLEWYAEEAEALAKNLAPQNPNPMSVLASVTVLSLDGGARARKAMAALAARAPQAAEPVAWRYGAMLYHDKLDALEFMRTSGDGYQLEPLYLAPQAPAAQPLTDDQIDAMLLALMHVTGREALTIAGRVTWDDATRHRLRSIVRVHGGGIAPSAPAAQPLTHEQVTQIARETTFFNGSHAMTNYDAFAARVEAHHGIGIAPSAQTGEQQ